MVFGGDWCGEEGEGEDNEIAMLRVRMVRVSVVKVLRKRPGDDEIQRW